MTTLLATPGSDNIWASMPGWGIVADLTPPELVEARQLHALRKKLAIALAIVVLLCAVGYVWAVHQASAADDRLAQSQANTALLAAQNAKYSNVIALYAATDGITNQVSTLMASDVDVAGLVQRVEGAAPTGTVFTSISVTLNPAGSASSTTTGPASAPAAVGSLTMTGTSNRMVDVASYVTSLQNLAGVVNVIPQTNSATKAGGRATWSITAQMTDTLYTHRFKSAPVRTDITGGGH